MKIPRDYIDGYAKGREFDPERSANYVAHTRIGDPLADAVIADLEPLGPRETAGLIKLGMHDRDGNALGNAPASVRNA